MLFLMWGMPMEEIELLRKLADECFKHFQAEGFSPFKCKQLVAENMQAWKKLPIERIRQMIEQREFEHLY